jgi:hypothetical protein
MDIVINLLEIISIIIIILALHISIINRKKKYLKFIQLYIATCLAIALVDFSYSNLLKNQIRTTLYAILNITSILEISLIFSFLYYRLQRKNFRSLTIILFFIYIIICAAFWIKIKNSFFSFAPDLIGIESSLIIIPCLFYIYEILNTNLNLNLRDNPNFIATCGILFYFSISIPIFFCWYTLYYLHPGMHKLLIIMNLVCSSILIISFMKAYLCPIPDPQH